MTRHGTGCERAGEAHRRRDTSPVSPRLVYDDVIGDFSVRPAPSCSFAAGDTFLTGTSAVSPTPFDGGVYRRLHRADHPVTEGAT